jgi:hypothetical protein
LFCDKKKTYLILIPAKESWKKLMKYPGINHLKKEQNGDFEFGTD